MPGRREQAARVIRRKLKEQKAPVIVIIDVHDGRDPIVSFRLDHRAPTEAEKVEALAKWKAEQAAAAQSRTQSNNVAAREQGEDEEN